jgi:hypothetical protein
MPGKIIIASDVEIVCPKCSHHFPLDQGITRQTIERYEADFDAALDTRRKELEDSLSKEAERKASRQFGAQLKTVTEQLQAAQKAEKESRGLIIKAQEEARAKVTADFEQEKQAFAKELADKDAKLKQFRSQEISLRQERQQLEDAKLNMEIELQRKLDEERTRIREDISRKESERMGLIEAEYKKKIEDAQHVNEDLRRKLEQGSQQLQGEVLELELEQTLIHAFRHDVIEEVKKGQRGADAIQTVRTPSGQECGKIIWEAKRAENWADKWVQKLKDDRREARADIAVLVTTAMPRGFSQPFGQVGDIWVVPPHLTQPLAETLRVILLEANRIKQLNTGKSEKRELLYNYLASPQFAQRVGAMMDSFSIMKADLDAEKRAIQKIWSKREVQLSRVAVAMSSVVGELQAIAQDSFPQLDKIETLDLLSIADGVILGDSGG